MIDATQDAELAARALAGSDAAFGRLVQRHQAAVRAFVRQATGSGWAEADDVAQEAFVAAWSGLHRLKEPARFRSWVCGIAWRTAQTRIRSRRRGAARDLFFLENAAPPTGTTAEDRLALEAALGELSAEQRACVALNLGEGWSHGEIAEILDLPVGTVKSHVQRGRRRLLKALGGPDDA
jgi:RNA polymerase sigma factor (sigma-70 family)